jgi:uncharacterized protein YcbX
MIRVRSLFVYPVKSCRGVALDEAEVVATGFAHDRQWLVIDRHGTFMTQRDWPAFARVDVAVAAGGLELAAGGLPRLAVPEPGPDAARLSVAIWKDQCMAVAAGSEADAWFTTLLDTPCRLVMMPSSTVRQVNLGYAEPGDRVGFADAFPFLLISQGSLDELNRRLEHPVPMDRFRPNIVVDGCEPHAEDGWSRLTIGEVSFRVAKPCSRCVITTTDQRTGERSREPLRTLAGYRAVGTKVLFGQNLIHDGTGTVRVGDPCFVEPTAGS